MKKSSLLIIFFVASNNIYSQYKFNFGIGVKSRIDLIHQRISNEDLIKTFYPFDDYYPVFTLGADLKKYSLSLNYSDEKYRIAYRVKEPVSYWYGYSSYRDRGKNIELAARYKLFAESSQFDFAVGLGVVYSESLSYNSGYGRDQFYEYDFDGGVKIYEEIYESKGIDFGKYPYYIFVKPQIELNYMPFNYLTLYLKSGMNIGFKEIGRVRASYRFEGEEKKDVDNYYKGDYFFLEIGARINFLLNIEKTSIKI